MERERDVETVRRDLDESLSAKERPTLADGCDRPPPSPWFDPGRAHGHALLRVPVGVAEAERRARWVATWDRWLRKHRWDFCATFTFSRTVSEERVVRAVARWLQRVRHRHPHVAAITGIEVGAVGGRWHVHALVYLDGARYGLPTLAGLWHLGHLRNVALSGHPAPWPHGRTLVQPYRPYRHPGHGAAAYTVKGLTGVEVHGDRMPPAYRPRRRR